MMIEIVKPTIRDLTFIAANMREPDRHELACQIVSDAAVTEVATQIAMVSPISHVVRRNDQPIAAFGAAPLTHVVWALWAFGTKHLWRAIPAISQHLWSLGDEMIAMGIRRLEVRAWKGHDLAPLWLKAVGCTYVADLSDHGRSGETFELWVWTATDYLNGSMRGRRGASQHVLRKGTKPAEDHTSDTATDAAGRGSGG